MHARQLLQITRAGGRRVIEHGVDQAGLNPHRLAALLRSAGHTVVQPADVALTGALDVRGIISGHGQGKDRPGISPVARRARAWRTLKWHATSC